MTRLISAVVVGAVLAAASAPAHAASLELVSIRTPAG